MILYFMVKYNCLMKIKQFIFGGIFMQLTFSHNNINVMDLKSIRFYEEISDSKKHEVRQNTESLY